MLIKSTELDKTRAIRAHFSGTPQTLILTFLDFLIECIECEEFETIKQMADVDYRVELKREPSFYEKVNAICEKYFNQGIKKQNGMQAMLSSMLGGGNSGAPRNAIGGAK